MLKVQQNKRKTVLLFTKPKRKEIIYGSSAFKLFVAALQILPLVGVDYLFKLNKKEKQKKTFRLRLWLTLEAFKKPTRLAKRRHKT